MALSITALSIMVLSNVKLRLMTISITAQSIMKLRNISIITLSIKAKFRHSEQYLCNTECVTIINIILNIFMLSVAIL